MSVNVGSKERQGNGEEQSSDVEIQNFFEIITCVPSL